MNPPGDRIELQCASHRWQGLRLRVPGGHIDVDTCEIEDARLGFVTHGSGWRLVAMDAAQVRLRGLHLHVHHAWRAVRSAAIRPSALHLQALHGLQGMVRAFVADAAWVLDAAITLPVHRGVVDFDRVLVEHLGPDSAMGISAGGVYIDAPRMARRFLYVFTGVLPEGIEPEKRAGRSVRNRGRLALPQVLHSVVHSVLQSGTFPGQWANPQATAALARSRVGGELQLGDGPLGIDGLQLDLAGHALGANRVAIAATALDADWVIRWPELVAAGARLEVDGVQGGCGRIDGQLELQVSGAWPGSREGAQGVTIKLHAPALTMRGLKLG